MVSRLISSLTTILSKAPKVLHSAIGSHPILFAVPRLESNIESQFFDALRAVRE